MYQKCCFEKGQNFTTGRSPEILGRFSKVCIKIIKTMKMYRENFRKIQFLSRKFSFFLRAVCVGKYKTYYIGYGAEGGFGGGEPTKLENISLNLQKTSIIKCKI